jgi:hypothetical protein
MQELNLPYHVIEAFEKKRRRKPQQQVATSPATGSTARRGTDSGLPVERRSRRPLLTAFLRSAS